MTTTHGYFDEITKIEALRTQRLFRLRRATDRKRRTRRPAVPARLSDVTPDLPSQPVRTK